MGTRSAGRGSRPPGRRRLAALALTALALLVPAVPAGLAAEPPLEPLDRFPQTTLRIESTTGTHEFSAWVAATEPRRNRGLMMVKSLPKNRGMLFLFDAPQVAVFWMKDTLIPLDLLFIARDGRVIRIVERATPLSESQIDSMGVVGAVLELAGGTSARLGIKPGDRVHHAAFGNR
jgi:uncharacterized membrane protein (UPF0127 family)